MLISIKKKIIISLIFIINLLSINSMAIVQPSTNFYVNDYANILNEETENYIINSNISLENQTGAQIVVVTVKDLEGNALEDYATELFREFGIGDKSKNNGVLLLLALQEREFRIEVGYGLEGILPDAKTGRIQDEYIIPYLKNDNWDEGIKNGFSAVLDIVAKEYNASIDVQTAQKAGYSISSDFFYFTFLWPALLSPFGLLVRKTKKRTKVILYVVLTIIFFGIDFYFIRNVVFSLIIALIETLVVLGTASNRVGGYTGGGRFGGFSGGGGHSSGGGFSGGGGSSRRRRKLKKFLK